MGRPSSELKILLSCAGLGMGNASRVAAIMEAFQRVSSRPVQFEVFSWGAGFAFLQAYRAKCGFGFQLHQLDGYRAYFKNCRRLRAAVRTFRPTLIMLDSDYHFPAYWFCGCPIVSVGQAYDVVERSKHYRFHSLSERWRWLVFEKLDSLVQTLFSHRVLVPAFRGFSKQSKKVVKIPLVVRDEFVTSAMAPSISPVGVLLSGSRFEREKFIALARANDLSVIAPDNEATTLSCAAVLDRFDFVITQGGLSSISECIVRGKFMIVVPLSHHPEQILNAAEVERLGLGLHASMRDLENLATLMVRAHDRRRVVKPHPVNCHGAEWAARLLLETL